MQTLLFVDDEPSYHSAIKRLLRRHSDRWQALFALSAQKALDLTRKQDIDVVVSDVNMPQKTGLDLLDELQASPETRNIPVIILTGSFDSDLKRIALEKGATDLLNKPVTYEDLVARLRSALRLKSYQDELLRHNRTLEEKVRERTAQLEYLHQDLIWRLAKAGEFRDEDTGDHVIRVAKYSRVIARSIGLSQRETDLIFFTAPLHDLGKIGIPDTILLKEGPLNTAERQTMETHCDIGASILLGSPKVHERIFADNHVNADRFIRQDHIRQTAALIALSHHERWDGTGYPRKLRGKDIPIQGRIVAVADVFDALCSKRSYKAAFSPDRAWRIILGDSGTHFDPCIVNAIAPLKKQFKMILEDRA